MYEILLYDQIVSPVVEAEGFGISGLTFKQQLQETGGDATTVYVNSPGGDARQAMAMRDAIESHGAVTYHVEGVAFSAATIPGLGAARRTIGRHSEMMIHLPWLQAMSIVQGTSSDLREIANNLLADADYLDKTTDKVAGMYAEIGNKTESDFRELMAAETWLNANEAKGLGLVDEVVTGGPQMFALRQTALTEQLVKRAPQSVRERCRFCDDPANSYGLKKSNGPLPRDAVMERLAELAVSTEQTR